MQQVEENTKIKLDLLERSFELEKAKKKKKIKKKKKKIDKEFEAESNADLLA